ncbi:MAG: Smr/MutS family protein [Xanthomonadaceae bacterium]|nr:Smr/MutS family protein [Xanthomonadaceae bacterium]MDP2186474.1 Smr/MutS family protein [Xanthomonadales bacterium]MDZ4117394.1 Smr/MutS family protein [Xanthomonadaceae bacterium]MDZ4379598.1 Smr/MutS family protein [Xanthomonadaceae bacterium]
MKRKPPVANDDAELFRSAIGAVRPLPESSPLPRQPPPKPLPRMRQRDEAEAVAASHATDPAIAQMLSEGMLAWRRPHVSARVLARLKRGEYAIQDELDLHGLSEAAARKLLQAFLTNASRERWHCLRVIHGKGLSSERGESVLRPLVAHLLSLHGDVLAFASAPQNQGGSGATLVLIATKP